MYEFREMKGLTRTAIGALLILLVTNTLAEVGAFYIAVLSPSDVLALPGRNPNALGLVGIVELTNFVVLLVTGIIVLRWMYRASVNAHAMADDLTISPGWAVGWYFVPLLNLWKPFEAMKETWLATHYGRNWADGDAPDRLKWWWGLWILSSFLGNGPGLLGRGDAPLTAEMGLADAVLTVPLVFILIGIMRQIRRVQDVTRHAEVFA